MTAAAEPAAWHQALAYAVTGRRFPELGRQERPDLEQVVGFLRARLPERGAQPPGPLPPDLAAGLGPAQLWAAVAELRQRLGVDQPPVGAAADRPLTPEEQRLLRDVPPHHGS